jgi:hypothetical protein
MAKQARFNEADGIAALGIRESLLIALTELKIIGEHDARDFAHGRCRRPHRGCPFAARRRRSIERWWRSCSAFSPPKTACATKR